MTSHLASSQPGRAIAASSIAAVIATLAVKALGVARQVFVARLFGAGSEVDLYLAAMLVPTVVGNVLGVAANSVVIPHLARIDLSERDGGLADHLAGVVKWFAQLAAAASIVCVVAAAPLATLLFGSGGTVDTVAVTGALRLLSPVAFSTVVVQGLFGGLNLRERYIFTSLVPAIVPLAIVVALVAARGALEALLAGTLVGHILLLLVVVRATRQEFDFSRKGSNTLPSLASIRRETLAMVVAMAVLNATLIVNQVMVSRVRVGALAAFDFGSRIPEFLFGLFGVVVTSVLAPHVAGTFHSRPPADYHRSLKQAFATVAAVGLLAAIVLAPASTVLVRIVFEGGAFDGTMVSEVASVQRWMFLASPFYFVVILGARYMNAMGRSQFVAYFGVVHMLVTIIGNSALMPRFGVSGVAAVFGLAYAVSAVLYVSVLSSLTRRRAS